MPTLQLLQLLDFPLVILLVSTRETGPVPVSEAGGRNGATPSRNPCLPVFITQTCYAPHLLPHPFPPPLVHYPLPVSCPSYHSQAEKYITQLMEAVLVVGRLLKMMLAHSVRSTHYPQTCCWLPCTLIATSLCTKSTCHANCMIQPWTYQAPQSTLSTSPNSCATSVPLGLPFEQR